MNKYYLIIPLIVFVLSGCTIQRNANIGIPQQDIIDSQQDLIEQQNKSLEEIEAKLHKLENELTEKSITNPTPIPVPAKAPALAPKPASENLELILVNYKIDVQEGKDIRESIVNAAFNSPEQMCPNVIATSTTRKNIYYIVIDDLNDLEAKYGPYKSRISFIDTNLKNLWGTVAIVRDQCASVGFEIGY